MEYGQNCDVWLYFDNFIEEGYVVCKQCKQRLKNDRVYVLRQHLKTVHSRVSDVWDYFNLISDTGDAECKECKMLLRTNRGSNLDRHVTKYHGIEIRYFKSLELKSKAIRSSATEKETSSVDFSGTDGGCIMNVSAGNGKTVESLQLANLEKNVNTPTDKNLLQMEKQTFKTAVLGLMIDEDMLPSVFDSKNMQAILKPVCDAFSGNAGSKVKINKRESEKVLRTVAENLRIDISNELNATLLSLKIDIKIDGPENIYYLSVSFGHEGSPLSRFLGLIDLKDGPHYTEQQIKQVLQNYNIESNQIFYGCWDHFKPINNACLKSSDYLREIETFKKHSVLLQFENIKFKRVVGIFSQLCLLDIFNNDQIFQLFANCRNFVKFISNRNHGFCENLLQNGLPVPELDSPWKCGSTYKMMDNLRQSRIILENQNSFKLKKEDDQFEMDNESWLFVDAFCESFKPIQNSIDKFSTEETHFGDFYVQWLKSKLLTEKLTVNNSQNIYIRILSTELLKCIEAKTNDFMSIDVYQACLYLDPRFQHTLTFEQKYGAVEFLKKLWTQSQVYNSDINNIAVKSQHENVQSTESCNDNRTLEVYTNIELLKLPFMPADTNILLYWKNKTSTEPELFCLSEICFAIPCSQNYNGNPSAHINETEPDKKTSQSVLDDLNIIRLNSHLAGSAIDRLNIFEELPPTS